MSGEDDLVLLEGLHSGPLAMAISIISSMILVVPERFARPVLLPRWGGVLPRPRI